MSAVDTGAFSLSKEIYSCKNVSENKFMIEESGGNYDEKYSYQIFYGQN